MIWAVFACYMLGVVLIAATCGSFGDEDDADWRLMLLAYGWPPILIFCAVISTLWGPIELGLWLGSLTIKKPTPEANPMIRRLRIRLLRLRLRVLIGIVAILALSFLAGASAFWAGATSARMHSAEQHLSRIERQLDETEARQ